MAYAQRREGFPLVPVHQTLSPASAFIHKNPLADPVKLLLIRGRKQNSGYILRFLLRTATQHQHQHQHQRTGQSTATARQSPDALRPWLPTRHLLGHPLDDAQGNGNLHQLCQ